MLECLETGLVYLDNPVDYESLESDFAWEKTYQAEKKARKKREPIFSVLSALIKKIRLSIRKTPKIERLPIDISRERFADMDTINLLDIGCGDGAFTSRLASKMMDSLGKAVVPRGIEISKVLSKTAHDKLSPMKGAVVQAAAISGMLQLEDESQDLIVMHSFLEHETKPLDLLEACHQKLSPQGLIIIKVPNYDSINRKVRQGRWCGFRYPDHVNYFSPNNLKLILKLANLNVYRMNFFDKLPTSDNMWVVACKG